MRWLVLGALLSGGLAGLAGALARDAGQAGIGRWELPLEERAADAFPRSFAGDPAVRVASAPMRAVAASVLSAEVLLELAPARLVAVHFLATDARYSLAVVKARGYLLTDGNPEGLLALQPDLVCTDPFTRAETQVLLRQLDVPVLRLPACGCLEDVRDNLRRIGYGMGLDAEVEDLVQQMDARLKAVRSKAADRSRWRLLALDGALHTYGRGSLFDDLVRTTGAVNLAAAHDVGPFRRLDSEAVLSWQPDAIVVGAVPEARADELVRMRQHPALRLLACVRAGRIVCVPPALLVSTSHHVAGAAETIASTLDDWGRP